MERGEEVGEELQRGWTIATALIQYKNRQKERKDARQQEGERRAQEMREEGTRADSAGEGIVVFDVETTRLIDEERAGIDAMEVSVACAMRLPEGGQGHTVQRQMSEAEHYTFWHQDAGTHTGDGGVQELLGLFDRASLLVAYNGIGFDMRVLRSYYGSGEAAETRYAAHLHKLHDPMDVVYRATGRRTRLSHLLQLNGQKGKAGSGCDAPGLWRAGRTTQLATYCMRDVEVLAALVLRQSMRVPGGEEMEAASVWPALKDVEKRREGAGAQQEDAQGQAGDLTAPAQGTDDSGERNEESGDGSARVSGKRRARDDAAENAPRQTRQNTEGSSAADAGEDEDVGEAAVSQSQEKEDDEGSTSGTDEEEAMAPPPPAGTPISRRRNKRTRQPEGFYDGARKRKKRRTRHGYMEKARGAKRKVALRDGIEVGSATIERIVKGRYEWRDMQYKRTSQNRVWDPGVT